MRGSFNLFVLVTPATATILAMSILPISHHGCEGAFDLNAAHIASLKTRREVGAAGRNAKAQAYAGRAPLF